MTKAKSEVLTCPVVRAKVLGVNVYRGFAKLADLADVSKADIYDQQNNPKGTQRDLKPAHARDAYEYIKNGNLGFWPEVFVRDERLWLHFIRSHQSWSNLEYWKSTLKLVEAGTLPYRASMVITGYTIAMENRVVIRESRKMSLSAWRMI
jgi:hypothetical protein